MSLASVQGWRRWPAAAAIALTAVALSGCVVVPARHHAAGPWVAVAPPAPYAEVVPARPYAGSIWIQGYWGWHNDRHDWVPGHWEHDRPGYAWHPHAWVQDGRGWHEQPGYWSRR